MTTYEHLCENCNQEFELVYGMMEPVPTVCPLCNHDGKVKRLISGGSGRGKVELTGNELKEHLKSEGQKLKQAALRDEKVLRDVVGDDRLHQTTTSYERQMSEFRRRG